MAGCSKNIGVVDSENSVLQKQISQMLQMDSEDAKLAYNLLDSKGKMAFTKRKLEITASHSNLNAVQKDLVNEIISSIHLKIFENEDERSIYLHKSGLLLAKLETSFSKEEIINYFFTIGKTPFASRNPIVEIEGGTSCNCNRGSGYTHCSNGCKYTYGCEYGTWGCGFAWMYECDGFY